jgi:tetratricopeptide (TPR) repeat protein
LFLGLFQLGLFAKTAISFLPASLLLVTWWRRERLRWRDIWPLIPMLGLVVAMGQLTFYIEHLHGAAGEEFKMGFLERVLISGRSFWFYLGKLFFPHQLTFIYERWRVDARAPWQYLYPITTAALLVGLWWGRRRIGKGLFVALLHFYVCTSLLILMVVLYMTRYSFVSDHWQYFGCMSVVALAAAGITAPLGRFEPGRPFLKPALCGILLLTLGALTWRQAGTFADAETLWRTTIARNPDAWMAHNDFGYDLLRWGRVDEAIAQFQKALEIKPNHASAHYYLGIALLQKGRVDEALVQFQKVLENDPDEPMANYNLGNFLLAKGRVDEAIVCFQKSLAVQPGSVLARNNLGTALLLKGQEREALVQFQKALEYDPGNPTAHYNLGLVLCQKGRMDEGIVQFQKALQTRPDFAEAHNNLGNALLQEGLVDEAIAHFQKALEIRSDFADARDNLDNAAWLLATSPEAAIRNGPKALALARQLDRLSGGNNPAILDTLAAACAETGQFPEAVDAAQQALALALSQNNTALANTLRQHIKLFQSGSPLRSAPQTKAAPGLNQP